MAMTKEETQEETKEELSNQVEISEPAPPVDKRLTIDEMREQGLHPNEIEMAKKHGMIKEEGDDAGDEVQVPKDKGKTEAGEKGKSEAEENRFEETTEEDLTQQILDGTEPSEEELDKYKNFTPNVRRLYRSQKKYQERAQKAELAIAKQKAEIEKAALSDKKLHEINQLLAGDQDAITQEAIRAIIDGATVVTDPNAPLTQADLARIEAEKAERLKQETEQAEALQQNLAHHNQLGQDKYGKEEFDKAMDLSNEVISSASPEKKKRLTQWLLEAASNPDLPFEEGPAEVAMEIAKMHPDFGKHTANTNAKGTSSKEGAEKVEKIIKNANKKPSNASMSGGSRKIITHDDLTPDDVINMSQKQWNELPQNVRKRLMGG